MPSTFGQNFLAGYAISRRAADEKARQQLEQQHFQLEQARQQAALDAQAAQMKHDEIAQSQADLTLQLKLASLRDQPTTAVSEEAGGVGPPAPGARETFSAKLHGGGTLSAPAQYRTDLQAQGLEQQQLEGQGKLGLAVEQAKALAPVDAEAARLKAEAEFPTQAKLAHIRAAAHINMGAITNDPEIQATVQDAADRVVSGEMTVDQARGLLGGVKGGLGPSLIRALGDRKVVPAGVRKDLQSLQTTRNIVDQMEQLVGDVVNAPTAEERAKATLLLTQYGNTTGTLLSRGFGERGVVTDKDVSRATGLVPGWKAANFAPDYAAREIKLLHETLDRNERSISEGYFKVLSRGGALSSPAKKRRVYNPATDTFTEQ